MDNFNESLYSRIEELDSWISILVECRACQKKEIAICPMSIKADQIVCSGCGESNMSIKEFMFVVGESMKTKGGNDIIYSIKYKRELKDN